MAFRSNWLEEQIVFHDTKLIKHTIFLKDVLEKSRPTKAGYCNLRKYPFSMNIDKAMSSNHQKVLAILVSWWLNIYLQLRWSDKENASRRSKFWKIFLSLASPPPSHQSFGSTESIFLLPPPPPIDPSCQPYQSSCIFTFTQSPSVTAGT